MWNWGTKTVRQVPFIDFQSPVMRKDLAKKIDLFPSELFHYGLDFYASIIAKENNLKIGVSDNITFCHLSNENAHALLLKYLDVDQLRELSSKVKEMYEESIIRISKNDHLQT